MQTKIDTQSDEIKRLKQEINRLKRLEEKHCLQESELHFYQEIIENIAEGVYLIRISDGAIVYTNPKFEQMFGYLSGEMLGQHVSIVNAQSDTSPEEVANEIMDHLNKYGSWSGEVCNIKKNGEKIWCHANVSTFNHSEYGEVWLSVHSDVTKEKLIQEELRKNEQQLRLITEHLPVLISYVDKHQRYQFNNRVYELWFEHPRTDVYGKHVKDVLGESAYLGLKPYIEGVLSGQPQSFESLVPYVNGGSRYIKADYIPHLENGVVEGFFALIYDVSDSKTTAEALQKANRELRDANKEIKSTQAQLVQSAKLAALGEMSTGVAHELNQPLQIINMAAEMIKNNFAAHDYEFIEEFTEDILEQVVRSSVIINHLRTFGRKSSSDRQELINVNHIIKNAFTFLSEQLRLQGIEIIKLLNDDISLVYGDPVQLEQVFINLLINARDALENVSEKTIRIRTYQLDDIVKIDVEDSGVGISITDIDKIFDPFFTTKKAGDGTGLGLSISYSILKSCNAEINVKSKEGQGCLFEISMLSPKVDV